MNVQTLNPTSVTPTHCVSTLKDPMSVAVKRAIRVMGQTAQVNIYCICFCLAFPYISKNSSFAIETL